MRNSNSGFGVGVFIGVAVVSCVPSAEAVSLRLADWNVANHPNNAADELQLKTVLGYVNLGRPIDVMAVVETDTASAPVTASDFASVFGGSYASVVAPADGGGDRTGFVYNPATVRLVGTSTVSTGLTHPSLRAQFRPVGTTGSADFYYYAVHLLSGDSAQIKSQRVDQAAVLRADADALGAANVIFGGDFNWQKADDVRVGVGAYRTFNAPGPGQVADPLDRVGDWHNNPLFKDLHTNDPGASMDDRFDMQLVSSELTDGLGLDYVAGSYSVVGNNNTHALGGPITGGTGIPAGVLSALAEFSDHLPVYADYAVVPEPALGLGLVVAASLLRRRRNAC